MLNFRSKYSLSPDSAFPANRSRQTSVASSETGSFSPGSASFPFHPIKSVSGSLAESDTPNDYDHDSIDDCFPSTLSSGQNGEADRLRNSEMADADAKGQAGTKETSPYVAAFDDPSSSNSPYLAPVLEEPSVSFSDDDDPLPDIEGLQIPGEAFPGRELQACGYAINGATSCNFEWVRHLKDGSVNYIDGAKQPNYLVTADDADTFLSVEVQPLDDRKRKGAGIYLACGEKLKLENSTRGCMHGEIVKVFANDFRKITCHPEMQNHIEKTLYCGHASYNVSFATGYLDNWELATLSIKREGYSIKSISDRTITQKLKPSTRVIVPYGRPAEFVIIGTDGGERLLRADNAATDFSCSRDTIVLILRLFIIRLQDIEKRKRKKWGFLFNK